MTDEPNWLALPKGPSLFGGMDHRFPHVSATLPELQTELVLHQGLVTNNHCDYHQAMRAWADGTGARAEMDRLGGELDRVTSDMYKVVAKIAILKQEQNDEQ